MWIIIALVAVPIIEIALFIEIGGWIGLWPTIAVVVATAIAGGVLLRAQGYAAINALRLRLEQGGDPSGPLAHGALILVAGVLMLTPGFFTDAVGFLLLVPPVRAAVIRSLGRRIAVVAVGVGSAGAAGGAPFRGGPMGGQTVDGVYEAVDPAQNPSGPEPERGQDGPLPPR